MYYIDKHYSKKSSGSRFFSSLENSLKKFPEYSEDDYKKVLINISSPLKRFFLYKLFNKKIIVRVDGNYSYPITKGSLNGSNKLIALTYKILSKPKILHPTLKNLSKKSYINFIFNLQYNLSNYLKIFLSDLIIYQSSFSRDCHKDIFSNKKYKIIQNSSPWKFKDLPLIKYGNQKNDYKKKSITLCTAFHKDRPIKGFGDLLLNLEEIKNTQDVIKISLLIFGYIPNCFIKTYRKKEINFDEFFNKNKDWVSIFPTYKIYTKELSKNLISCDAYIHYAQLDPCPNLVLEALSHGLPIIGCNSGGVPDIIKDCGEILAIENPKNFKYQNFNFEYGLKPPKKEELFNAILKIKKNYKFYSENIRNNFRKTFSSENSVSSYYKLLKNLTFNN